MELNLKGCIVNCLKESIINVYGKAKWNEIEANIEFPHIIIDTSNISDSIFIESLNTIQSMLNITWEEIFNIFSEHWIFSYAHKIGFAYFLNKYKSSREALPEMDRIHRVVTINVLGSNPPSFKCSWVDENTLLIDYYSDRNLIDLCLALIKAMGKYYNDNLAVEKMESNSLKVSFYT
jgi:hypothetical protein